MSMPVNIICMKWGTKYGPEYVNRLYRMIDSNVDQPFQLTCFTDISTGILPEVNIEKLPQLGLPDGLPERGWNKLATFQSDLAGLTGDVLFLDLDVVITGSLDEFFSLTGDFYIIRDVKFRRKPIGNSSAYRFRVGEHQDILKHFQENFEWVRQNFRNEQAYLSHMMREKGLLQFWPADWCPSFKYHCVQSWPISYFKDPVLPKGARIVIFHGHPLPDEAIQGKTHNWYRPIRPTSWITDYWDVKK